MIDILTRAAVVVVPVAVLVWLIRAEVRDMRLERHIEQAIDTANHPAGGTRPAGLIGPGRGPEDDPVRMRVIAARADALRREEGGR